jgi:transcriptional regulator with XRE-family HTH domain
MIHECPTSKRLGEKLYHIRAALDLTQIDMIDHLGLRGLDRSYISDWEHGKREPSVNRLLRYAYAGRLPMEALADDAIILPSQQWIRTRCAAATKLNRRDPTSGRLGEKLFHIRTALNLFQIDMIEVLGLREVFDRAYVSFWENGKIEPPLIGLLRYARAGGVSMDAIADDAMNFTLPLQIC